MMLDGVVRFPHDLWLAEECAGTSTRISLDSWRFTFALPVVAAAGDISSRRGPQPIRDLEQPVIAAISMPWPAGVKPVKWGHYVPDRRSILVRAARVRFDEPGATSIESFPYFRREERFEAFFAIVSDWLRAWTGLYPPSIDQAPSDPTFQFFPRQHPKGVQLGTVGSSTSIAAYHTRASTPEELAAAIVCGTSGLPLPAPQALLYRAVQGHMHQDYRQSVVDCCTAAEVSLANSVRRRLEELGTPAATAESTLRIAGGVVDWFRLWALLGARPTVSEGRVIDQLAGPRNQAAHAGAQPTEVATRRAIGTAGELVSASTPLPTPAMATALARRHCRTPAVPR
jgi:hypothetical protein